MQLWTTSTKGLGVLSTRGVEVFLLRAPLPQLLLSGMTFGRAQIRYGPKRRHSFNKVKLTKRLPLCLTRTRMPQFNETMITKSRPSMECSSGALPRCTSPFMLLRSTELSFDIYLTDSENLILHLITALWKLRCYTE